ncbi:acyl carrier protein [Candidatus Colwellia aromaticivorans]|uniref:acyl carrier protein n=1 Tax=Candidatus Colwellia aromaticivorans TaxID=2267621 RepID=UPI000DF26482|nr:acyl carrier protein [Candidatus Colwellia aromaticivorans]
MQSREEIYNTLSTIFIDDFEIEPEDISLTANLYEDLDLDSIDAIDLIVKLKAFTGQKIEPDAFKKVRTVNDIIDELSKLLSV